MVLFSLQNYETFHKNPRKVRPPSQSAINAAHKPHHLTPQKSLQCRFLCNVIGKSPNSHDIVNTSQNRCPSKSISAARCMNLCAENLMQR
jgi:hypothetical protein